MNSTQLVDLNIEVSNHQEQQQAIHAIIESELQHLCLSTLVRDHQLANHQYKSNVVQLNGKKIYSRITIEVGDIKTLHHINENNKALQSYDVIAIRPKNEKVWNNICKDIDFFDIVTLDLKQKLPFMPRRPQINELVERNVYIEINLNDYYADECQFLSNCSILVNATKGKNLIISTGEYDQKRIKRPIDRIALSKVIGLNLKFCVRTVNQNPSDCLKRSLFRKSVKGIVDLAKTEEQNLFYSKSLDYKRRKQQKATQKKRQIIAKEANAN